MATEISIEVTQILNEIQNGSSKGAENLLPLVYNELRRLAASQMAGEKPGQTLQPTALVHEAYIRLLGRENQHWENRRHFFATAAEAMRRILVDKARQKRALRHGGGLHRMDLDHVDVAVTAQSDTLLAVHEALQKLEKKDPASAELIKLRFFVGLPNIQAAQIMGIPERSAKRLWAYARAWLYEEMHRN